MKSGTSKIRMMVILLAVVIQSFRLPRSFASRFLSVKRLCGGLYQPGAHLETPPSSASKGRPSRSWSAPRDGFDRHADLRTTNHQNHAGPNTPQTVAPMKFACE